MDIWVGNFFEFDKVVRDQLVPVLDISAEVSEKLPQGLTKFNFFGGGGGVHFFRGGRAEVSEKLPQGFQRPASPVLDVWVEIFLN